MRYLVLLAVLLASCASPYSQAVELYVSSLSKRGALYYDKVEPELRKELVLNDAALACLVDEENDRLGSPACACAKGQPDSFETNCDAWLGGAQ